MFELTALRLKDTYKIRVDFLLIGSKNTKFEKSLLSLGFNVESIFCINKTHWPKAIINTILYLRRNKVKIIHCHLKTANFIGLSAGMLSFVPFRIYTRHHAMEHHRRHRRSLIFDYISNIFSTHIVSTSNIVTNILYKMENVHKSKIFQIPPVFDLNQYCQDNLDNKNEMIEKYKIKKDDFIVGICSRFDPYKGVGYIIEALSTLTNNHKNIKILFFGAKGIEFERLKKFAKNKLPFNSYEFINFEKNMIGAYSIMDIFIHVPITSDEEAFGLVYVEAMASAKACIFTISGIAEKLIKHNENALTVRYKNSSDIYYALEKLYKDKSLRKKIGIQAQKDVLEAFPENEVYEKLYSLYKKLICNK